MAIYIFSMVSTLLLAFYGFAVLVLIRERKGMLLLGCSLLNVFGGLVNGIFYDMISYSNEGNMNQWQTGAYAFFGIALYYSCVFGLAAVIINAVVLPFQRKENGRG